MTRNIWVIAASGVFVLCNSAPAQAQAEGLYLAKCATCHARDGSGKTAMGRKLNVKGIRLVVSKMSAEEMVKITEEGKDPSMPPYGEQLSKTEIKVVVDYYRGLAK